MMHVNPTRMELSRLKKRLMTAQRGHKLLKDKRDELMKRFLHLARQNRALRRAAEQELQAVYEAFIWARALMPNEAAEAALMLPGEALSAELLLQNSMSVMVPQFRLAKKSSRAGLLCYGLAETSGAMDAAVNAAFELMPRLLELAGVEKACCLLAREIEKTRRRVNALEHVMIPQLSETIRFITMKLEENERGNITRLMKVKDLMLRESLAAKRQTVRQPR